MVMMVVVVIFCFFSLFKISCLNFGAQSLFAMNLLPFDSFAKMFASVSPIFFLFITVPGPVSLNVSQTYKKKKLLGRRRTKLEKSGIPWDFQRSLDMHDVFMQIRATFWRSPIIPLAQETCTVHSRYAPFSGAWDFPVLWLNCKKSQSTVPVSTRVTWRLGKPVCRKVLHYSWGGKKI